MTSPTFVALPEVRGSVRPEAPLWVREGPAPAARGPRLLEQLSHALRARSTARLVHDLGVNLAGVAVILDLVEARRRLMRRVEELQRLLGE